MSRLDRISGFSSSLKPVRFSPGRAGLWLAAAAVVALWAATAQSATWVGSNGNWFEGSSPNWDNGGWSDGDATFGGTYNSTITISEPGITVNNLFFNVTGDTIAGDATNNLTLNGGIVVVDGSLTATIRAPIAGARGLEKRGNGTLTIYGDNTYSGGDDSWNNGTSTMIRQGTLRTAADNVFNGRSIGFEYGWGSGATLDLNNYSDSVGHIWFGSNDHTPTTTISTGTGTLTLTDDLDAWGASISSDGGATKAVISGNLNLGSPASLKRTIISRSGDGIVISANVSGGAGVGIEVLGQWVTLSGANTYSGDTYLNNGKIRVGSATILGSDDSITSGPLGTGSVISNNGTLSSDSATPRTIYNPIVFNGNSGITLGDATNNGTLTLVAPINLGQDNERVITMNSPVNFAGGFTVDGERARVYFQSAQPITFSDPFASSANMCIGAYNGTHLLTGADNVVNGNSIIVFRNGTFDFNGHNDTVGGTASTWGYAIGFTSTDGEPQTIATGSGTLTLMGGIGSDSGARGRKTISGNLYLGIPVVEVQGNGAELFITANVSGIDDAVLRNNGGDLTVSGDIIGNISIRNDGGKLTLSGANTFTGMVTNNAGMVVFNSAAAFGSHVTPNVTVNSDNYNSGVAAGYAIDQAFLGHIEPTGRQMVVALGANSSNDLDFSTATGADLPNASLGAIANYTYSGTLTPDGTAYRLGGSVGTLTVSGTNKLTGQKSLVVNGGAQLINGQLYIGGVTVTGSNDFDGGTTIQSGLLTIGNAGSLGTGPLYITGDWTCAIAASGTVVATNPVYMNGSRLNIGGTGVLTFGGLVTMNSNGTIWNSNTTATTTFTDIDNNGNELNFYSDGSNRGLIGNTTVTGVISGSGGLRKNDWNSSTVTLSGTASTYTGRTYISGDGGYDWLPYPNAVPNRPSALVVTKLANIGEPSSIGRGNDTDNASNADSLWLDSWGFGTLKYVGTGDDTDRLFTIDCRENYKYVTLESSGTGALNFTNTGSIAYSNGATTKLVLGGSYTGGANTFSPIIGDNGGGQTWVTKNGPGTWVLAGANTYTGDTTVNAGTLTISGSPTGHSDVTVNSGGTLNLDYTVESSKLHAETELTLAGGAVTLNGGSYVQTIGSTVLNTGAATISRPSGTAVLSLGAITANPGGSLNLAANGIARTSTDNVKGMLGTWATVGGVWAKKDAADGDVGAIIAFTDTDFTDIDAQAGGTHPMIVDNSLSNVRIRYDGSSGPIGLSAATTTVNTLLQNHATIAATVDTGSSVLATNGIAIAAGKALTIGIEPNDGTLQAATSGGSLVLNNFSANTLTVNAAIADNGNSGLSTTGNVLLNGNNTYKGSTYVCGGVLEIGGTGTLGYRAGDESLAPLDPRQPYYRTDAPVFINSGATLNLSTTGGGTLLPVPISGGGTLMISGPGQVLWLKGYWGTTMDNFTGSTVVQNGAILDVDDNHNNVGDHNLTLDGGKLQWSNGNPYFTSAFTLGSSGGSLGTIWWANGGAYFASTDAIKFTGSGPRTLTLDGAVDGSNNYRQIPTSTLCPSLGDGDGGVTSLVSQGEWTLLGTNTYSGTTTVVRGTLTIGKVASIPGGAAGCIPSKVTVESGGILALAVGSAAGGRFDASAVQTVIDSSHLGGTSSTGGMRPGSKLAFDTTYATGDPANLILSGQPMPTFIYNAVLTDWNNNPSRPFNLLKIGVGILVLNRPNTFTGTIDIQGPTGNAGYGNQFNASILQVGDENALGAGNVAFTTNNIGQNKAWLDLHGYNVTLSSLNSPAGNNDGPYAYGNFIGNWAVGTTSILTVNNTADCSYFGDILDKGGDRYNTPTGGKLALVKDGPGTLNIGYGGDNDYSGGLTIKNGTLAIGRPGALGKNTSVTMGDSGKTGVLRYFDGGSESIGQNFTLATGGTGAFQVDTSGQILTLTGVVTGGGSLAKKGPGTLTLTNALNGWGGDTTVDQGTLSISGAYLANAGLVTIASAAVLNLNFTGTDLIGALNLGGVSIPEGTYGASHETYGSYFTGTGLLQVGGAVTPTYEWKGANGVWTDSANWNNTVPAAGNVAVFSKTGATGSSAVELGAGSSVTVAGLTFSGNQDVEVKASTGNLGKKLVLDNGSDPALVSVAGTQKISSDVQLTSDTAVTVTGDTDKLTISGDIDGTGKLTLTTESAGTLVLGGELNTYSGGTVVSGGTLVIGSAGALPAGRSLSIGSGGTLILGGGMAMGTAASAEPVPEPGTLALLAIAGLAGLFAWRRRSK